jgi:DNA helicase-2/ATP-dependent DNA helicase PcrA
MDVDQANMGEQVSIMTLHAAKGLEFETVFLPGWEEGLFPHQRALDETGLAGLEEERRLAYVGLTRAKKRCIVTHAANRRMHGTWTSAIPSRFIDELPRAHIVVEGEEGLYAGRRDSWGMQGRAGGGWATGLGSYGDRPAETAGSSDGGGPGWRRLQARGGATKPVVIDARAELVRRDDHGFGEGERVFHQKFGPGTVLAVDGDHLTIEFDHAGQKKLVASFVSRA